MPVVSIVDNFYCNVIRNLNLSYLLLIIIEIKLCMYVCLYVKTNATGYINMHPYCMVHCLIEYTYTYN